ncbi:MAG: hypothetical protein IBV52_03295 [Candidatus Bathyarchaeota archaeon]
MSSLVHYFAVSSREVYFFPLGIAFLAIPLVVFIVGVVFSVTNVALRKPVGATLIVLGVLELLPFLLLLLGLNDISYVIPFMVLAILFVEGCVTLLGGVFIFTLGKQSPKVDTLVG